MLVAVPTFQGRVSPTFDFCHRVTFWQMEGAEFAKVIDRKCRQTDPLEKAANLQAMGTDLLLCGAISQQLAKNLEARGVRVVSGLAGDVREVLAAMARGALDEPRFRIPGAVGKQPVSGGAP